MIALGSRGLGPVKRLVMGSVSEGVVHGAPCPVLVLRGGEDTWPPKRIVIGDDGSRAAEDAGELAASIGNVVGATVLLIRAYPRLPEIDAVGRGFDARMVDDELHREEQALGYRAAEIESLLGVRPRIRIGVGDPADELLEAAGEGEEESTLVAVGSRGSTRCNASGSVASRRRSSTPRGVRFLSTHAPSTEMGGIEDQTVR